eukprot:GHVQ01032061.1.p2 GENE.GHVQ01032061.1~~GHVQ01032061.1.p2  ORF type:complete len:113 (-),score=3.91 GHVQ01032061.1:772-1110(-)
MDTHAHRLNYQQWLDPSYVKVDLSKYPHVCICTQTHTHTAISGYVEGREGGEYPTRMVYSIHACCTYSNTLQVYAVSHIFLKPYHMCTLLPLVHTAMYVYKYSCTVLHMRTD